MVYFEKKGKKLSVVDIDKETEQQVLEEAKKYKLIKVKRITWERLDDDRSGSDFDVYQYPLSDKENCPIDYSIVIKDGLFYGVNLFYTITDSWNAGLNKKQTLSGCALFIDGSYTGSPTSKSTYDSPNNYDEVEIEYSLKKI